MAIWGCGPVGQFAIRSAFLLGAEKVIAIDRFAERLCLAREAGAEVINFQVVDDLIEELKWMTGGRGPDACIDAVGIEAPGHWLGSIYDRTRRASSLSFDRPTVLRQAIHACRKGGTLSIPGVYGGSLGKIPLDAAVNKGLTLRTGQTHAVRCLEPLLERVRKGEIDPSFVVTHRMRLDEGPAAYKLCHEKRQGCIKVVLDPWGDAPAA